MTKRERLYPEIKRLREDEGLMWREIGERLGIALTTAQDYYADPTGEKARVRKLKNARACLDCGKTINTDGRVTNVQLRCVKCAAKVTGAARKVWTEDAIVAAIQEWASIYGEHPRVCDWHPTQAAYLGREPHPAYLAEPERWPHMHTVMREFGQPGGWARAVRAAGFTPRAHGETDRALAFPSAVAEARRLSAEGLTQVEIARRVGVSPNTVYRRLRARVAA